MERIRLFYILLPILLCVPCLLDVRDIKSLLAFEDATQGVAIFQSCSNVEPYQFLAPNADPKNVFPVLHTNFIVRREILPQREEERSSGCSSK